MKELNIEEVKCIQLQMLSSFVNYCENNNLEYFLCAGTAIGALRHNGYIPWDDDIDVMMPRKSYEKFLSSYVNDSYEILSCWNNNDYVYPYAKLTDKSTVLIESINLPKNFGVYIDVFPIDNLPSNKIIVKLMYLFRYYLDIKWGSQTAIEKKRTIIKTIEYRVSKWLFRNSSVLNTAREIDKFCRTFDNQDTRLMGRIVSGYGLVEVVKSETFEKNIYVDFEQLRCRLPIGYDNYLRNIYGDYMTPPPIAEQVLKHSATVYYKE